MLLYHSATSLRALESRNNEARRVGLQVELQIFAWIARSRVKIPRGRFRFSRLQACDNDCTMQCAYSDACWAQIIVIVAIELHWFVIIVYVWDVHDWLSIVISPSENIIRKRVIFKKRCPEISKIIIHRTEKNKIKYFLFLIYFCPDSSLNISIRHVCVLFQKLSNNYFAFYKVSAEFLC